MDLDFTHHAVKRMTEFGITGAMIDEVLSHPRWTPATGRGARYDGIVLDGRRLCVVVDERRMRPLVVTAFWYGRRG